MLQRTTDQKPPLLTANNQTTILFWIAVFVLVTTGSYAYHSIGKGNYNQLSNRPDRTIEFKIDLNLATWTEFAQLPGIGEGLGKRIVEHRTEIGKFDSFQQLCNVQGIGEKKLDQLTPFFLPLDPDSLDKNHESDELAQH